MQLPYFYEPFIDTAAKEFSLSEDASRHAVLVLRMKAGEQLQITDGEGMLVTATIIGAHKKNTVVQINTVEHIPYTNKNIGLAIAPTKNIGRIEWLLEKVTEIGIKSIVLLQTSRTERTNIKAERLQHILVSAMLQSRQAYLPELSVSVPFEHIVTTNEYAEKYIAHCLEDAGKTTLQNIRSAESKIILIGPEGDFTEDEINLAIRQGFKPVSLGHTRLRTETAGLVAAVVLTI